MKRKRARLRQLADLAREVMQDLEREPLLENKDLLKEQLSALDYALRRLDLLREYFERLYDLRQAFGVELDNERGDPKGDVRWPNS